MCVPNGELEGEPVADGGLVVESDDEAELVTGGEVLWAEVKTGGGAGVVGGGVVGGGVDMEGARVVGGG